MEAPDAYLASMAIRHRESSVSAVCSSEERAAERNEDVKTGTETIPDSTA